MKRTAINLLVDLLMAAMMLAMIATGWVLWFVLPPGSNKYLTLWELSRHEWGRIHAYVSIVLTLSAAAHLCLHWKWVVVTLAQRLTGKSMSSIRVGRAAWLSGLVLAASAIAFATSTWFGVEMRSDSPCAELFVEGEPPLATETPIDFLTELWPILRERCLDCHGSERAAAGFRVDRRESLYGDATRPRHVVPGDSGASDLVELLSGRRTTQRQPSVHRLSQEELLILCRWIEEGAVWDAPSNDP